MDGALALPILTARFGKIGRNSAGESCVQERRTQQFHGHSIRFLKNWFLLTRDTEGQAPVLLYN